MSFFKKREEKRMGKEDDGQLDFSEKLMFDPLKRCLSMLDGILITETESFPKILAKDMLRFLSGMSMMSDNGFKKYVCNYYNYVFSDIMMISPADLESCASQEGLDGIYYKKDGEIFRSSSYVTKLTEFSKKVPDGLRKIINNYYSFGKKEYDEINTSLFTDYQLAVCCFCDICERYDRYYDDFYSLLNNCLIAIGENIPERFLIEQFKLTNKTVYKIMKRHLPDNS